MPFNQLKEKYTSCQLCPELNENRTQVVFGDGNSEAKILFIGEAPGASEDKQGIPFCGASGQILIQLLDSVNLSRKDIFITNTILCRPPNNRNPNTEELNNCKDRLDQLIQIMQPEVIVTIGNFATERIIKKKGITTLRGKTFTINVLDKNVKVIPVVHPASYLYSGRNPELFKKMSQDFQAIAELLKSNKTQKTITEF